MAEKFTRMLAMADTCTPDDDECATEIWEEVGNFISRKPMPPEERAEIMARLLIMCLSLYVNRGFSRQRLRQTIEEQLNTFTAAVREQSDFERCEKGQEPQWASTYPFRE